MYWIHARAHNLHRTRNIDTASCLPSCVARTSQTRAQRKRVLARYGTTFLQHASSSPLLHITHTHALTHWLSRTKCHIFSNWSVLWEMCPLASARKMPMLFWLLSYGPQHEVNKLPHAVGCNAVFVFGDNIFKQLETLEEIQPGDEARTEDYRRVSDCEEGDGILTISYVHFAMRSPVLVLHL